MAKTKISDLISPQSEMGFINYHNYAKDNKEFLRGDMWEFTMRSPKIVYYPGDEIFKTRLNQINLGVDTSVNGFEKRMRGNFVIIQKTGQNTSGQITLQFTDREDQAITYFVDDWRQKIADRDTKYSFRKDDLVSPEAVLKIFNSGRTSVRTLKFYNCIIRDAGFDENGVPDDGSDRAEVTLTMDFEHYERNFDNLM